MVGVVANSGAGSGVMSWSPGTGTRRAAPVPVRVADVLDAVKANHGDDTVGSADAEMLAALVDGVIRGAQTRGYSRWAEVLGPVLKPGVASKLLDISTTALDKRRDAGAVLGVRTDSGRWIYPLAQFRAGARGGAEVLAGLRDVLVELRTTGDGLASARWLATPNRRLRSATPWQALDDPDRHLQVVAAARAQAAAWAGR